MLNRVERDLNNRPFLNNNPVLAAAHAGTLSTNRLGEVIIQYCFFPARIVHMLTGAAGCFAPDSGVCEELERNIQEELGSKTGGVSHVKLLLGLLSSELGLSIAHTRPNTATRTFLRAIDAGMEKSRWYALGQAFALEASAVPELARILGPALNAYACATHRNAPISVTSMAEEGEMVHFAPISSRDEAVNMGLDQWIAMHVRQFEVGHRDLLREQAIPLLLAEGPSAQTDFEEGFTHVLDQMDAWWQALAR